MFRRLPPVCLSIALFRLITGKLILTKHWCGRDVQIGNGKTFVIFRNIKTKNNSHDGKEVLFAVSFKFARLSHKANKIASIIPMLIIAGYPGFIQKIYAADPRSGYWQGIYRWKSQEHLDSYKKSLVFRIMNKRAIKGSVNYYEPGNLQISDCVK